jgi:OmpA-OmpF porin, OOP family
MKNELATTAGALFLLSALFAGSAWSQNAGFYAGAALGQVQHKDTCEDANISCDDKDTAWKILAGYQFNRHLAVEAGYADLGKSSASGVVSGVTASASFEVTAWELVGIGSFPVMDRLSLYGKLGVYRAETEARGTASVPGITATTNEKDTNSDVTFGFGARYDITRNLGVRAEWQRYRKVGGDDTGEADIDLFSLGLMYRF